MLYTLIAVIIGFVLDMLLGDPQQWPHPIRWIGREIAFLEKKLREWFLISPKGERLAGLLLVILVAVTALAVPFIILRLTYRIHPIIGVAVESWLCYRMLAVRSLRDESMKVYRALKDSTIERARYAVSMIVGRDTDALDEEGVAKAAVETVAENTADGCIAPLFYMMIFGACGGFVYKAVNTMDSMVGYKNERWKRFGTCAARLDDVLNYLPSRLCALLMIVSCIGTPFSGSDARRIWKRDRRNHASPNSAQSESAMAGALGVQLAGDASYFGEIVHKPTIGDAKRPIEAEDIVRANRLLYRTAFAALICFGIIRLAAVLIIHAV